MNAVTVDNEDNEDINVSEIIDIFYIELKIFRNAPQIIYQKQMKDITVKLKIFIAKLIIF